MVLVMMTLAAATTTATETTLLSLWLAAIIQVAHRGGLITRSVEGSERRSSEGQSKGGESNHMLMGTHSAGRISWRICFTLFSLLSYCTPIIQQINCFCACAHSNSIIPSTRRQLISIFTRKQQTFICQVAYLRQFDPNLSCVLTCLTSRQLI